MRHSRGQGFLALIFFIGSIVVAIGATLVFIVNSSTNTIYSYQIGLRAEAVANSGIYDGVIQLQRDVTFSSAGYTLMVGSDAATVSVTQTSTSFGPEAIILSTASISNYVKEVQAVVSVTTSTGDVRIRSWETQY